MAETAPAPAQDTTLAGAAQGSATIPGAAQNPTPTPSAPAAGDGQPKDGAAAGGNDKGKGTGSGTPEAYQFKAPEGVELDTKAVEAFTPIAKELGLSQDQAQKLVDLYGGQLSQMHKAQVEAYQATVDQWAQDAKADKEIGGAAFDKNVTTAQKAIAKFATPELKTLLNDTGLGNHPELIRLFMRVGASISEDTLALGGKQATGAKDPASVLYGNTTTNR